MGTTVGLIWAQAHQRVIGKDGVMPWHLPEDLAHFKSLTTGSAVIMGRKTWESIPERFRPLPGRRNIVVTRQTAWHAAGAELAHSLPAALALCAADESVWVMGGAQVYAQALPLADVVEMTQIDLDVAGDSHAPVLDAQQWQEKEAGPWLVAKNGLSYRFVRYDRVAVS